MTATEPSPPDPLEPWKRFQNDPQGFAAHLWPDLPLAEYQREILDSVRDNNQTFVYSGHKMGKSLVAAMAALWFFATRSPATVLVISATEQQLEHVMWAELRRLLTQASDKLPFVENKLRLRLPEDEDRRRFIPRHELIGCGANQPESLQGRNLPRQEGGVPTVLVVCEEASAIPDRFIESLLPQAHRLLAIGNPLCVQGWFYDGCRAGDQRHPQESTRLLRRVRHLSPEESPNVSHSRAMDERGDARPYPEIVPGLLTRQEFDEWNVSWDERRKRTRLFGLLPDEADQKLFPPEWLELARRLGDCLCKKHDWSGRPYGLGVDVAYGGGNLTAWVVLGRWGVRTVLAKPTPNTVEITGRTIRLMRKYGISDGAVAFDAGGGGKQIADVLRDKGYENVIDVPFGAKANDPAKYRNRRAELYGQLREAMEPNDELLRLSEMTCCSAWPKSAQCVSLPPDESELFLDLAVLPLLYDGEGRLRLPPKDQPRMKASGQIETCVRELLGGRSPDRGDALVLAYYAWSLLRGRKELETVNKPLVF